MSIASDHTQGVGYIDRHGEPRDPSRLTGALVDRLDEERGVWAMWLFIASEATLFALIFFSYYYTAKGGHRWQVESAPSLIYVLPMLGILLLSSFVLHFGEKQVKKYDFGKGRIAIVATLLLGAVFLVLSYFDYRQHMQHVLPTSNAYGSAHYTIISLHLSHLILGMFMLLYVLVIPRYEPITRPPHRAYHCASMYWHFVDTVWVFIVTLLYIVPQFRT